MFARSYAVALPVFVTVQSIILAHVNKRVPKDYMDEVFHGPQAREYCRGNFASWHPKITTFPGLYYLGTLHGWARWTVESLRGEAFTDIACSTPYLRSLNVVLSALCLLVLYHILKSHHSRGASAHRTAAPAPAQQTQPAQQHAEKEQQQAGSGRHGGTPNADGGDGTLAPAPYPAALRWLHAATLSLYPLHWFFSFLFYTDVASLLFLLLCHLQAARRRYFSAALAGGAAVLCRQTNAVWAAFVLGEALLDQLGLARALGSAPAPAAPASIDTDATSFSKADAAAAVGEVRAEDSLVGELAAAFRGMWRHRARLAARLWPLLLPPAGFIVFLVANGGCVVLGDKESHVPVRHGAQVLYFGAWAALMLWPQMLPEVAALARGAVRRPLLAAVLAAAGVAAAAAVAHVSTLVHPFMLADNRHYVFYLWRRVIDRTPTAKYALTPAYAAAWALLLSALRRRVSRLWLLGFLACLAAQLLPAWLLELRYFTPGFFMMALHLEPPSGLQAAASLYTYLAVNAFTMLTFLYRPYMWVDGTTARFLW